MKHPLQQKTKLANFGTSKYFFDIFSIKMDYPPQNLPISWKGYQKLAFSTKILNLSSSYSPSSFQIIDPYLDIKQFSKETLLAVPTALTLCQLQLLSDQHYLVTQACLLPPQLHQPHLLSTAQDHFTGTVTKGQLLSWPCLDRTLAREV